MKSLHRTQKPVALCEWLIKSYSNENDLVLDFTMGSGTTGVACERNLSQQELNDLSKNTSIYLLTDGDIDNFIQALPKVNIYYLNFSRYTLKWYDLNKNFFENDITIYWRTIGYINKDNIEKLNVSHKSIII
eukprot:g754.t1